jgi:hypothetical protein
MEPFIIIRNYRGDLSLLEHEFGHENGIRIAGLAPREVTAMTAKPAEKRAAERSKVST